MKPMTANSPNIRERLRISGSSASCPAISMEFQVELSSSERIAAEILGTAGEAHARAGAIDLAVDAPEKPEDQRSDHGREQRLDRRLPETAVAALRGDLGAHDDD